MELDYDTLINQLETRKTLAVKAKAALTEPTGYAYGYYSGLINGLHQTITVVEESRLESLDF